MAPAMRAPVLGACAGDDPDRLAALVRAATLVTHTDPRALEGAHAIAVAAWLGRQGVTDPATGLDRIRAVVSGEELGHHLDVVERWLQGGEAPAALAAELGLSRGVTGYVNHTVPVVLGCWLRFPADVRAAVEAVVELGGDTDSTGALVGALAGVTGGEAAVPRAWLDRLWEWPRSVAWLRRLAVRLAHPEGTGPLPLAWPLLLPRNLLFAITVLAHGFRRLLPPYGSRGGV